METETLELDKTEIKLVTTLLNEYLANYHVHYQKLRACHWNVTGTNFFPLHVKFEELYDHALQVIDDTAERILALDTTPISTLSAYMDIAKIKEIETKGVSDRPLVQTILDDFKILIQLERQILVQSAEANDDGTNDMINGFMQFKEKNSWMLKAYLK
ncbi:Non-specific DNA-binding protein Dps [Arcticibacter svalbardensis MN12-7]|uniref:Non-specific DNA-binding protein Dps n=1 Tax=Arcticibacter svalbardensis MN12-7 TaxID=1150600 RepID=R9GZ89_9SPHI|nr:DNA starvation/stationary phase protection protein [Arcticibacter svalbardensis]EOR94284.1 Non-specific DNA-binding protein Dps [Arcticibacter svalbardensis MN12-7]